MLDLPSAISIAWNASVGCVWTILFKREHKNQAKANISLLVICLTISWPFLCLDELSLGTVVVFLLVWDVFAVRSALGPFRLMAARQRERIWMSNAHVLPLGLLYETPSGFSLGTGDLAIYGVVSGRASMRGAAAAVVSALGVLVGHCSNVFWAFRGGGSIPALPSAVIFSVSCCVCAAALAMPALRAVGSSMT